MDREANEVEDPNKRPAVFRSTFEEIICVIVLTLSPALGSINVSGILICLPKISETFGGIEGGQLSWTMSAASLGCGSFLLTAGQLADVLGRKKLLCANYLLYSILALAVGFVKNYIAFVVLRALQGVTSAFCVVSAVGILGSTYKPSKRKNYAFATFAAGAPVGFVIGIITSGIATEFLSWQSSLWFFAIVYFLSAILAFFTAPNDPKLTRDEVKQRLSKLDFGGVALAVSGFTLFVFSLSQADAAPEGWKTPYVIALLVVGVVLIAGFCVYEAYVPANPLMPMHIWKYPGFALCMAIIFLGWADFTGCLTYYPNLLFQDVWHASPILSVAYFVPMAVAGTLVNVFAGFTLHLIPGRILMLIAYCGFTAAALLWTFVQVDSSYWAFPFPAFILAVVGADLAYNVANLHALSTVDSSLQSTAGGVFNTVAQLSTAIGLAASSSIVASVTPEPASPEQLVKGYHAGFYFALACGALGLVLSVFFKVGTHGATSPAKRTSFSSAGSAEEEDAVPAEQKV